MNKVFPYKEARRVIFGPFLFLALLSSCAGSGPEDAILMVNGEHWLLEPGEQIVELDETRVDGFADRIGLFREEPALALYRMVQHADYTYYLALPTDATQWSEKEFQCETHKTEQFDYHLADSKVFEDNRIVILMESKSGQLDDGCSTLEKRAQQVKSTEE